MKKKQNKIVSFDKNASVDISSGRRISPPEINTFWYLAFHNVKSPFTFDLEDVVLKYWNMSFPEQHLSEDDHRWFLIRQAIIAAHDLGFTHVEQMQNLSEGHLKTEYLEFNPKIYASKEEEIKRCILTPGVEQAILKQNEMIISENEKLKEIIHSLYKRLNVEPA